MESRSAHNTHRQIPRFPWEAAELKTVEAAAKQCHAVLWINSPIYFRPASWKTTFESLEALLNGKQNLIDSQYKMWWTWATTVEWLTFRFSVSKGGVVEGSHL